MQTSVESFQAAGGELPRAILVQNHGLIVPGKTAEEVLSSTQMAIKSARVLLGTMAFGGPHFLPSEEIDRLCSRPDEALRKKMSGWEE